MAHQQRKAPLTVVEETNESLMQAIQDGSEQAFARLVDRCSNQALTYALRIVNYQREMAEDIVQKVFIKIWQHPDKFDATKAKFTTWLYRVVSNQALDEKRKRSFTSLPENYDQEDTAPNAEEKLEKDHRKDQMIQAIETLPEKQRIAVMLTYFDELSNAETAEVMNISVKALESLLVRGRKQLRNSVANTDA